MWVNKNHLQILLVFVSANCTNVFQPTNVILQRSFKHAFREEFDDMGVTLIVLFGWICMKLTCVYLNTLFVRPKEDPMNVQGKKEVREREKWT